MPFFAMAVSVLSKYRRLSCEQLENRQLLAVDVLISEFVASNGTSLLDEDGESSDWIELYNAGAEDVNLAGWHLTDDANDRNKWSFPPVDLPAGAYLVVFASDKDRTAIENSLHTNFKLTADGEYLALARSDATADVVEIVSEFSPAFLQQFTDVSYGVTQELGTNGQVINGPLRFFEQPTPGSQNSATGNEAIVADEVKFSHPHGFYEDAFSLSLRTDSPGTIRYTLDGSEPTQNNGSTYRNPIRITGTETVRARAYQAGRNSTSTQTATYLFLDDIVEQSPTGSAPSGFPTSRTINGQSLDYGMDPDIVDDPVWATP